ncbi:c-type cytochrome [Acetobacter orientalis]|uniref:Alcohol dehydrogenase cytochrome c n=1 Tax=Acetobacter orientalis TaxID=146474 RepID=A0A0D6NNZ6_9PROT|nr:alcohol dehydrogenase cytochrome c [Acetobacter orientalis]GBR15620.1 sorbitol dehydrogenase cytochrome c subunit [Acetobacter orientalis NRIC 0481]GEL61777.1 cytochrome c [Acetobacter orientalis]
MPNTFMSSLIKGVYTLFGSSALIGALAAMPAQAQGTAPNTPPAAPSTPATATPPKAEAPTADTPAPAPAPAQAATTGADAATLERGAYIATAADCVACHTKPGGIPYAGGLKISTPMGDVISTNITPDPEHGIGAYTEQEFDQAVRHGVRRDGAYLYPVMPYVSYAGMTDQDVHALYLWFKDSVKPVATQPKPTELSFPANMRSAMAAWNFVTTKEQPETGDSATYDPMRRGRYLTTALEHCGTCHTPRNFMLSEKQDHFLAGASLGAWYAPNVTSSKTSGIGTWSEDDLVAYLRTGRLKGHAQAAGPMGEAVEHSTSKLTDKDLHAIAAYVLQVPAMEDDLEHKPRDSFGAAQDTPDLRTKEPTRIDDLSEMDGPHIYDANCSACHGHNGAGTLDQYAPSLFANSTVGSMRPDNLVMTILHGVNRNTKDGHAGMPGFDSHSDVQRLSNSEIAKLTNYLTATYGSGDAHVTPEKVEEFRKAL